MGQAGARMIRPGAPAPMLRRGPRPLLMHLMLHLASPENSPPSEPSSTAYDGVSSASKPNLASLGARLGAMRGANLGASAPASLDPAFLAGLAAYRRHPFVRDVPDPPILWQDGETCLLDYGADGDDGMPALFVPSLVNRGSILDLTEEHSMLRWLSRHGVRPMLVEWGWPGPVERNFTITDYIARRLEPAMEKAASLGGGRVTLLGYCMGGLFCIAAARHRPDLVAALGLIATPWDFHATGPAPAQAAASLAQRFAGAIERTGTLPIDAIQLAFAGIDPPSVARKFARFGALDQSDERTRLFVAIEDWLNDGVPLAGPVARECLLGWYGENRPAHGNWQVGGSAVDPAQLTLPTLLAIPQRDRIVPPESAASLATSIRQARVLELPGGHVSIVAGPRAQELLWEPLRHWLHTTRTARPARPRAARTPRPARAGSRGHLL